MGKYAGKARVRTGRKLWGRKQLAAAGKPRSLAKRIAKPTAKRSVVRRKRTYTKSRKSRGGGGSFAKAISKTGDSYFSLGRGPKLFSGFKRTQLPTTFTSTITQRIEGTIGTQAVYTLPTWKIAAGTNAEDFSTSSAWTVDSTLLERANQWLAAYQEAIPATAPGATTALRGGVRATMKFVVNHLKYDQMIRNMSTSDADVVLYDCVFRSNVSPNYRGVARIDVDPMLDWENGLSQEQGPSREVAIPGARLYNSPGTTPFHSTGFCKLYRIAKVTKKTLAAGEVHHHHVTVKPRQMFDGQREAATDNPYTGGLNTRGQFLPGITGFTLIVVNGSIMNDNTNKTLITTSTVGLDVVTKCQASFSQYSRERRMHYAFDGLATNASNPGMVLKGVSDDTGAIIIDERA